MNQSIIGSVAVVGAALLWSLDSLLRVQLYSLPPSIVVFWEHALGFIILLPLLVLYWRGFKQLTSKQWLAIGLVSFLSGALGTILYTAALGQIHYIQFSVVVLLQQLQPLFAIGSAIVLLREPVSKRFGFLVVFALVGAYLVSFPHLTVVMNRDQGTLVAAALALGAAACWGMSTAFSKFSLKETSFLHITAVRFGLTPVFALLLAGVQGQQHLLTAIQPVQWRYLLFITFSTGLVALLIYYFGLQRVPASRSALLELAWPLSALLVGYFFLHETLTPTQWLGSLVLVGAMTLVSRDVRTSQSRPILESDEAHAPAWKL